MLCLFVGQVYLYYEVGAIITLIVRIDQSPLGRVNYADITHLWVLIISVQNKHIVGLIGGIEQGPFHW